MKYLRIFMTTSNGLMHGLCVGTYILACLHNVVNNKPALTRGVTEKKELEVKLLDYRRGN